ncbi:YihY/virulence factor BrkB family protein [Microbacterium sp.]|uniref:YihY/virulence factor BrkB family protein n=1 Tax=Microbacterium sp. TaxID=51671 RepID=UPI0037C6A190
MAERRSRRHPEPAPLPGGSGASDDDPAQHGWEAAQSSLRERLDEPIARATAITRRTLAWFPVRVWRHFLRHNGFLLAASISYQSLFAIFAVVYVAFATVGLWLGGSTRAIDGLIRLINSWIPNLISENGLVTPEQVESVASESGSVLAITGAIAVVVALWTAISFVTFTRRAVRDIFGLPFDSRNYFYLKARDLLAAIIFGLALVLGAGLGVLASGALDLMLSLFGLDTQSFLSQLVVKTLSLLVAVVVNGAALGGLVRFLTGAELPWHTIWPGALAAGVAIAVLQVLAGLLFQYTPTNPLLLSFSVFIGFLLWFRFVGIVILVGAAWIAVTATDRHLPIQPLSEAERLAAEHEALTVAARVRLRVAEQQRTTAPWYAVWAATRDVRRARDELARLEATAPPRPADPWLP